MVVRRINTAREVAVLISRTTMEQTELVKHVKTWIRSFGIGCWIW